jgi:hypothetical protein
MRILRGMKLFPLHRAAPEVVPGAARVRNALLRERAKAIRG